MSIMVGANLEQMASLEGQFGNEAAAVSDLIARIEGHVTNTTWVGRYADEFRGKWEGEFRPALNQLVEALGQAQTVVASNRQNIAAATGQGA
jgi:uncharacterized protein YukE